jgi:hypothetical protein
MIFTTFADESSARNADNINHEQLLAGFADEGESCAEMWRDLVEIWNFDSLILIY